ncbi:hypothetical protein KIPB_015831, partial [Kipferlia bialata]
LCDHCYYYDPSTSLSGPLGERVCTLTERGEAVLSSLRTPLPSAPHSDPDLCALPPGRLRGVLLSGLWAEGAEGETAIGGYTL